MQVSRVPRDEVLGDVCDPVSVEYKDALVRMGERAFSFGGPDLMGRWQSGLLDRSLV